MATATTTEAARAVASNAQAYRRAEAKAASDALNHPDTLGKAPLADVPDPPAPRPARPTTLAEAAPWLLRPFAQKDISLKPGALTKDRTRALAMPHADMRAYFVRLDKICGVENWSHTITLSERGAVCALTLFGVTKSATGDYPTDKNDENAATSAEAQAFKRACSAFGLGRYLYSLPQIWAEYDEQKKQIVDAAGVVARMYASLPRGEE